MEYLVNISKRHAFWSLNEDILKITILTTNTPYPSRKIRRIRVCTHQRPQRKQAQYAISREDQYAIWYDEDIHDLRSVETEFPAIAFTNEVSSGKTLSYEPTVMIGKRFGNDYEKVLPSLPSHKPAISCFDDLDFFKDFENEFPVIVYNDAQTSKSNLLTEPNFNPQHIDEFDLNDETSLSEYKEDEQNVLYFNDLFPFNIIHSDDFKSEIDNDDNDIDIILSSNDMAPLPPRDQRHIWLRYQGAEDFSNMAPLPPRDQRHLWLHYQVEGYTEEIVHDFEQRLETIFGRQVNRVHILDFEGLTPDMRHDLAERMRMVYTGDDRQEVFVSHAWMRLFGIRAPLVHEFILEFFSTFRIKDEMGLDVAGSLCFQLGGARGRSERLIPDKGDLSDYWVEISSGRDFLRGAPSYTYFRDPVRRLCHRLISYSISGRGQAPEKVTATDLFYLRSMDRRATNIPYLLVQYLFRHAVGRKSGARLSGGHFIGRLAHHFGLVSDDGLRGLSVVARELPLIDMERQQVAAASALRVAEDAPAVDEGDQDVWAPVQAPQQPPPPPPAAEIDDRSGEILHMDDFMYGTADGGIKPGSTIVHEYVTEPSRVFTPKKQNGEERVIPIIMEYLVNISKRRAFWSLNEDILKINDSDYQYAVSIKEDTTYPCLHSPKTTKETSPIRRIQRRPIRRIKDIVCEDFERYQSWSLLQETLNTLYPTHWRRKSQFSEEKKSRRGLVTHSNP
ncbi:hypothetical protein Tco_1508329 [Tanacetum coccineum]